MRIFSPSLIKSCIAILLVTGAAFAQDRVKDLAAQFQGKVSIYAKNLKTGATYDLNGSNRVNTASTIKLPIVIAVFTSEYKGKVHWPDTSELTKRNKSGGFGSTQGNVGRHAGAATRSDSLYDPPER
jgi:beta-lactamase class A